MIKGCMWRTGSLVCKAALTAGGLKAASGVTHKGFANAQYTQRGGTKATKEGLLTE
jgi:hypothetical protein